MQTLRSSFLTRSVGMAFFALGVCPALVEAEITAAADFPLTPIVKAVSADPQAKLLELYRQDVLTEQRASKKAPAAASSSAVSR